MKCSNRKGGSKYLVIDGKTAWLIGTLVEHFEMVVYWHEHLTVKFDYGTVSRDIYTFHICLFILVE